MPGHMKIALTEHEQKQPKGATYAPHPWERPKYGQRKKLQKRGHRGPH